MVARPVFHRDAQCVYPGGHLVHVDTLNVVAPCGNQATSKVIKFNALGLNAVIEAEVQLVFHGVGVKSERFFVTCHFRSAVIVIA